MARSVAEFLSTFVLPLSRGGDLVISRPISSEEMLELQKELGQASAELVAVDEARTRVISALVVKPPALVFDDSDLHLCAALHNLLFLAHPRASGWTMSSKAERRVLATAMYFADQEMACDRHSALARHGLFHRLFALSRADTKVSWWTGSATFLGQRPPPRLTSFRTLRRVREERVFVGFPELLGGVESQPVVSALLRRTPLTQLLAMEREGPILHWEETVFILRDAELARAVAYGALAGDDPRSTVAAPARFAAAFEQMLERAPAEADVRAVAAFLVYLNALLAMAEIREREPGVRSPLLAAVLAPERAGQRARGLATFFALPGALAKVEPRLSEPPGLRDDPALAQRWDRHRSQVLESVGGGVVEALAARLRRHLTAVLGSSPRDGEPADR
jgi:hypothetical protein